MTFLALILGGITAVLVILLFGGRQAVRELVDMVDWRD